MLRISNIKLSLDEDESCLIAKASKILGVKRDCIFNLKILKKSLDARKKDNIFFTYTVGIEVAGEEDKIASACKNAELAVPYTYGFKKASKYPSGKIFVVGFGPAGMFAAFVLARAGLEPIVLERGSCVEERQKAVEKFWKNSILDENTNVQFGEGGAGTFSDGKLTTGIKDKRRGFVLQTFYEHGAPEEILYLSKPHIGTDNLPKAVKSIREDICSLGGEILFRHKMISPIIENGKIRGIIYEDESGNKITSDAENIILAIGHSSRDTFRTLHGMNIAMERKPFAVGVRIEHLQKNINIAQYGKFASHRNIPVADYKLVSHFPNSRSAYTFCMCPGGEVVGAASSIGTVTVNGMSNFLRNGENSNSALLVNVMPEDFEGTNPLAAISFQEEIEHRAFLSANCCYKAPAQLVGDFLNNRPSYDFGNIMPTYKPGVVLGSVESCLPKFVTSVLKDAITDMDKRLNSFACYDAVLTAPETRSSSPVRIIRNDFFESPSASGLFPCGEGAGYAGGIMSSAVDGIHCAEIIIEKYL